MRKQFHILRDSKLIQFFTDFQRNLRKEISHSIWLIRTVNQVETLKYNGEENGM